MPLIVFIETVGISQIKKKLSLIFVLAEKKIHQARKQKRSNEDETAQSFTNSPEKLTKGRDRQVLTIHPNRG